MNRVRVAVFIAACIPFAAMVFTVFLGDLGPDPAKELALESGEWAIRCLLLALTMTPLRQLTGRIEFSQRRRMIGLFAFFYASVHFLVWLTFLLGFRWGALVEEVLERPYITLGFAAYLILTALAVTSPRVMVRRLGRNWRRLHRLVYAAGALAIAHVVWIVRTDLIDAVIYGGILVILYAWRLYSSKWWSGRRSAS